MVKGKIAEVRQIAVDGGSSLGRRPCRGVLAGESGYLAAVAANGHRTPAAAASARIVVEEQATMRISANAKACTGALGDNFRPGASHSGEQPIKTSFSRHEFHPPYAVPTDKFIVPFGDAKYFIYRLGPFAGHSLLSEHSGEYLAQSMAEPLGLQEQGFRSLGVGLWQVQKVDTALIGDNARRLQKVDEALPGQHRVWRSCVHKIDGEPPSQQWEVRSGMPHRKGLPQNRTKHKQSWIK
jgi:hypothetical protein